MSNIYKSSLVITISLALSACGGGGGSDSPKEPIAAVNAAPTIAVIEPQSIIETNGLSITAQASDSDGSISTYLWEQVSGSSVELTGIDSTSVSISTGNVEEDETVELKLTVTDNDGASTSQTSSVSVVDRPEVSVENVSVIEGHEGITETSITVSLNKPWTENITFNYSTSDDSATKELDYQEASGSLVFTAGETSLSVNVNVVGDNQYKDSEDTETFNLELSDITNADNKVTTAILTIENDDLSKLEAKYAFNEHLSAFISETINKPNLGGAVFRYMDLDLDNDDDTDIAVFTSEDWNLNMHPLTILRNNKGAGFSTEETEHITGSQGMPVAADFNGDGLDDLYWGDEGHDQPPWPGRQNRLFFQTIDGQFTDVTATHLPTLQSSDHSVCANDIDNDGDIDLYIGSSGGEVSWYNLRIYINDGAGKFTDESQTRFPSKLWKFGDDGYETNISGTTCAFADTNNDGLDDLIIPESNWEGAQDNDFNVIGFSHSILENDGSGYLTYDHTKSIVTSEQFSNGEHATSLGIATADIDNDGCDDFAVYTTDYWNEDYTKTQNQWILYRSKCGNGFEQVYKTSFETAGFWMAGINAKDLNGDGLMDFYTYHNDPSNYEQAGSEEASGAAAYINKGNFQFEKRLLTKEEKEDMDLLIFKGMYLPTE